MEQQSTGEDKQKISRSKARHLRRKRLAAARRNCAESSLLPSQSNTEQNPSLQEADDSLSKSKARRLRKKEKAELIKKSGQIVKTEKQRVPDFDNQTELVTSSSSPTNVSEYDKSDRNLSELQFDAVESCESTNFRTSLTGIEAPSPNPDGIIPDKNKENDTLFGKVLNESDSLSSDNLHVYEPGFVTSVAQRNYQLQKNSDCKVLPQGTSINIDAGNDIKLNQNSDGSNSLFKTELYETFSESNIRSELFDGNKSLSDSQILLCDYTPDLKLTGNSRIPSIKSNQLIRNNEVIKEREDVTSQHKKENENKLEGALCNLDIKSSNPVKTTASCSLKTDSTSDDDLDSPSSNSSSNLIDQYEINTIHARDPLGVITRTVKTVLNTTELIENEKNLKISNSSSNSHSVFQPNATVIDLTTYSSSDLIINTDSISRNLEEQQIIIDFISDSSSDLVQNNNLFYTNLTETSSLESKNKSKIHKKSVTEDLLTSGNQSSFDIIKDYSLPSTSINVGVLSAFKNSKDSVEYKTVKDSGCGSDFYESEGKMSSVEKTREQIKAERETKKAAKALAKGKAKAPKPGEKTDSKLSKDTQTKAGSSEQVQKEIKQNVVVKKDTVQSEEKIATAKAEITPSSDNKENESQSKIDGKSKRESRAERRAKQEAQRAAKENLAAEKSKPKSAAPPKSKPFPKDSDSVKMIVRKPLVDNNLHEVKLFKHLYHERELSLVNFPTLNSNIHPAIIRLGVQYASKVIIGSNARCVALLAAVKQLVEDFERPSQADFTRGLEASLQECAAYLHHCRPMAVSMQNALRHLKWQMTQLPTTVSDDDAKSKLGDAIDTYIREQILLAGKAISNTIQTKISNGDVILTYAFSSLIHNILIDAHVAGKQFRVIVVDGRPWLEGKEQLRRLAKHGIECSYILINALSFIMPEVTKVFLGAHAILANGAVMSRAGTAQVALMAKAFNVPVLVACETHKSCERVQTDSFVYNEIGDADELARNLFSNSKKSLLFNWKTKKSLDLLNITFDVTPADLVSAVVTELAILPCTSIPVILRIKPSEI